jgi:hypothetical protein
MDSRAFAATYYERGQKLDLSVAALFHDSGWGL